MSPKYCDPGFPEKLLEESNEAKIAYFENHIVRHRKYREALSDLLQAILHLTPGLLVYFMGPTGAGKSTLINSAQRMLVGIVRNVLRQDLSRVPYGSFVAWKPERGSYDWFQHYRNTLEALDDLLIHLKLPVPIEEWQEMHKGKVPPRRALGRDLRYAVLQAFKNKQPYAMFVDEAQRIATVTSQRKFEDELEVLKGLARDGRIMTTHVLTGTQQLLGLAETSGQNARVSREVYLLPYYGDDPDDFRTFVQIVLHLQRHLPLPDPPNLKPLAKYLHAGSLGLVGRLKEWIKDTLADVLFRGNGKTITQADLERNAFSEAKLAEIAKDVRKFDKIRYELRRGAATPSVSSPPTAATPPSQKKPAQRRVGRRNPKRDPVGAVE